VIGGHAISAIDAVLGDIDQIGAVLSQRRQTVRVIETGETVEMKTPDHLMANAILRSGAPLSLQLRGGVPRGTKLLWEISGSEGDLRVTARNEYVPAVNISPLLVPSRSPCHCLSIVIRPSVLLSAVSLCGVSLTSNVPLA